MRPCHLLFGALLLAVAPAGLCPSAAPPAQRKPAPNKPAAKAPVFTEEMTWEEVRDALKAGKTTILIPTGGVEQNGPHVVTGKHNFIIHATSEAIARKLGNALVAPVVPFVPEGKIDPPTGHMKYPGTISVREKTFRALLTDVCASYRAHGFVNLVLIGDSSGNQKGMKAVAKKLNSKWAGGKTRVHYVAEYYEAEGLSEWLEKQGIREDADDGIHDSYEVSAILASIDPKLIRMERRKAAGTFSINGVDLHPVEKTAGMGRRIIDWYAETTVKAIKKSMAAKAK
jgi:creatinine amidohydrolase/Fe(II)-dependent formamide hydrolase-like protein